MASEATELLGRVPLFSGLDPRELETISRTVHERTFNAGDTVAEEGQGGVGFFVIKSGEAKVFAAEMVTTSLEHPAHGPRSGRSLAQRTQRLAQGSISSRSDGIEALQRSHFP